MDCKNLIVYLPANESLSSLIAQENNIKPQETYGTAAAVALYCAKELGAKEIFCAWIDLAFKNDEFYSDGKGKIEGDNLLVDNYSMHLTEVKSKDGNMVKTRDDYASFIPQFETICKKFGKGVKVYNVTDFGAYIEGMEYKKLSEILPSKKSKVNTDKIKDKQQNNSSENNENNKEDDINGIFTSSRRNQRGAKVTKSSNVQPSTTNTNLDEKSLNLFWGSLHQL